MIPIQKNDNTQLYYRQSKDIIFISLGVISASIGLKGLLLPNNLLDGGAMGIALLSNIVTKLNLEWLIILVNLPFLIFGWREISLKFTIKSFIAISILALCVHFMPIPAISNDKLLISVFGGLFLGGGIGLSIRGGAVIDGTEVLAIYVSRKTRISVGDFIGLFNISLFLFSLIFIKIENAMYSMLIYFIASKTIDFILNGIEEYVGLMIVSDKYEEVKEHLTINLQKGATSFQTIKGYGQRGFQETNLAIYSVISRLEVTNVIFEIQKIDPNAFIIEQPIKNITGGLIKRQNKP